MNVYQCIAAVSAEVAKTGIAKDRSNQEQRYKFRGIDDVYNTLAPIIAKHGLVISPRILNRVLYERTTAKGNPLFNVVVEAEFDFISSHDGSKHVARTFGEAMDTADKATNKAMSAAYKYAAFQTFCIPTEGDNDADAHTHEVAVTAPDGFDDWWLDMESTADNGIEKLQEAFGQSKVEFRRHMNETRREKWNELKKKAEAKSNELKKAQVAA